MHTVKVKTSLGEKELRIPSALKGAKLVKALDSEKLMSLMSVASGGSQVQQLISVAQNLGEDSLAFAGAIIGISLIDGENDCLKQCGGISFNKSPRDFGEEVYEVLHEKGYTLEDVLVMAFAVGTEWMERNKITKGAQERLGFKKLMKAQSPLLE